MATATEETVTLSELLVAPEKQGSDRETPIKAEVRDLFPHEASETIGFEWIFDKKKVKDGDHKFTFPHDRSMTLHFRLKHNNTNRPFVLKDSMQLAWNLMSGEFAGQWNHESKTGNGESLVTNSKNGIGSAAHRFTGLTLAYYCLLADFEYYSEVTGITKKQAEWLCIPDAVVVTGADPKAANTYDTGRGRKFHDVLAGENLFKSLVNPKTKKKYSQKAQITMARILSEATRLVQLRTTGKRVSSGGKITFPVLREFLKSHKGLIDLTALVYEMNGGNGMDGNKLKQFVKLGYVTGLFYLMTHCKTDPAEFQSNSLGKQEGKAKKFWKSIAENDFGGEKNSAFYLRNVLGKNAGVKTGKYSRDEICTVIANAWNGHMQKKSLSSVKIAKREDLTRMGGLDRDREEIGRQKSGKWKVTDTAWYEDDDFGTVFIEITEFSDNGKMAGARYQTENKEWGETIYEIEVSDLLKKKPKATKVAEVDEDDLEDDDDEYEEDDIDAELDDDDLEDDDSEEDEEEDEDEEEEGKSKKEDDSEDEDDDDEYEEVDDDEDEDDDLD